MARGADTAPSAAPAATTNPWEVAVAARNAGALGESEPAQGAAVADSADWVPDDLVARQDTADASGDWRPTAGVSAELVPGPVQDRAMPRRPSRRIIGAIGGLAAVAAVVGAIVLIGNGGTSPQKDAVTSTPTAQVQTPPAPAAPTRPRSSSAHQTHKRRAVGHKSRRAHRSRKTHRSRRPSHAPVVRPSRPAESTVAPVVPQPTAPRTTATPVVPRTPVRVTAPTRPRPKSDAGAPVRNAAPAPVSSATSDPAPSSPATTPGRTPPPNQ